MLQPSAYTRADVLSRDWIVVHPCSRPTCPNQARNRGRFCSDACRRAANKAKWLTAPAAAAAVLQQWTIVDASRLLSSVELAFEWCGITVDGRARRAQLMADLGLTWDGALWARKPEGQDTE